MQLNTIQTINIVQVIFLFTFVVHFVYNRLHKASKHF